MSLFDGNIMLSNSIRRGCIDVKIKYTQCFFFFFRGGARAPNTPSPSPGYGLGNLPPILSLHKVHILSFLAIVCNLPVPMGNFIFEHLNFDKLILFLSANLGK